MMSLRIGQLFGEVCAESSCGMDQLGAALVFRKCLAALLFELLFTLAQLLLLALALRVVAVDIDLCVGQRAGVCECACAVFWQIGWSRAACGHRH